MMKPVEVFLRQPDVCCVKFGMNNHPAVECKALEPDPVG